MGILGQISGQISGRWSRARAQTSAKYGDFVTDHLYHRSAIDQTLIEDLLELIEKRLHALTAQSNWSLTLYILYSQSDSATFGRWEARRELKKGLIAQYRNELKAASGTGQNIGRQGLETFGYSLWLPSVESGIQCRLKDYDDAGGYVDLDLYLAEDNSSLTAGGQLSTLVRVSPIMRDQEVVSGALELEGNIAISPHLEVSQRGARGESNRVYLSRSDESVVLGPHVGCDLYAPSLDRVAVFTPGDEELKIDKALRSLNHVNPNEWQGADFRLRYSTSTETSAGVSFGQVLEEREATKNIRLQVMARILPRVKGDGPNGYGSDWGELSSQVAREVKVSIRLDARSSFGIDSDGRLFVWLNNQRRLMEIGDRGSVFSVNERKYRWEPDETGIFYGSLYFEDSEPQLTETRIADIPVDKEATWIIARGSHSEFLPLLPHYTEDGLISRRGSVVVHSNGRGTIEIRVANNVSNQLFFWENGKWRATQQSTLQQKSIGVFVGQEFVFGSSRYRLTRQGKPYLREKHWSGAFDVIRKTSDRS
jgi:hypothetical protein